MSIYKEQNFSFKVPLISSNPNKIQNATISISPISPIHPIIENHESPKFVNPATTTLINCPTNSIISPIINVNPLPPPYISKEAYFSSEDKIPYVIKITASFNQSTITIEAFNREEITLFTYFRIYTREDLSTIYSTFNSFETIKDIFDSFCSVINKKKVVIKKQNEMNKDFLELVFGFFTISGDEHELEFKLNKKQNDINEIHQKLWEHFSLLQKKIKRLKSEDSVCEQKLNKIEKTISTINDKISSLNENEEFLLVKNKLSLCDKIIDSKIIPNKEKYAFLEESYRNLVNDINCEKLKFTLIYCASINGDSSKKFHEFCDNKKNILCLIKTNKNKIIGGFSEIGWRTSEYETKDRKAFLFSLTEEKIYPFKYPLNNDKSLINNPKYGAFFASLGGASLAVLDNAFKNGGTCCTKDVCLFDGYDKNYDINDGEAKFGIKEIECFQIDGDYIN